MQPPLTPQEMEALKTPQIEPVVDTASPFASVDKPYGETTVTAQDTSDEEFNRQLKQDDYSYSQYWSDIAGADWATTNYLINSFGDEGPDPNWKLTDQHWKTWKENLPEYMWDRIAYEQPMSEKQFNDTIDRLKREDEINKRLSSISGWGEVGRFGLGMLDPAEVIAGIGAEIATAGTATAFLGPAKLSRMGRVALGATSNAALGVGFNAVRDKGDMTWGDYGWSMGFDALLGGVVGHIDGSLAWVGQRQIEDIKAPRTEREKLIDKGYAELERLRQMGEQASVDPFAPLPGKPLDIPYTFAPTVEESVPAMVSPKESPTVNVPTESTVGASATQNDSVIRPSTTTAPELQQSDAPQTHSLDYGRVSVLGQSMRSDSPTERLIMPHLGEDAVGRADGSVTPISTAEYARQKHTAVEAAWHQALVPAYKEWMDKKGFGAIRRFWNGSKDFEEFSKEVYDFIEDTRIDANTHYDPSVVKAGTKAREILHSYAQLYNNPGLEDGLLMRSIAGAERLKPDPHYFPKIADREAIDELTARYGVNQIKAVVRAAVEDAMTSQGYDIKPELMDRVAEGWFTNISKAGYGQEDGLAQILAGRSKAKMYEVLGAAGIDEDTVKQIVSAMDAKDAKQPRLKNRTPINYRYEMQVKNLQTGEMETFRPLDFFDNNIHHVMMSYSRRAAGDIAFGRLRIKDPTTTSSLMVDGITSRAEFEEKILKPIADDFQRRGGGEKGRAAAKAAQDRAEFLYKATMGLPLHEIDPDTAKALRRVRDYNFLRLMNAMGVTQTIEFGRILSMSGFRAALAQMPSLKRIIDPNTGSLMLKNKMARELEMWGVTENDYWIGAAKHAFQEERLGESATKAGTVGHLYDKAIDRGKEVLANTSFQRPVHSRQQQWAARAAVQWFADNARDMTKFAKFKDRIADLGLNEQDMKRIHDQIVKYAEAKDPDYRKITAMNFDKWDDAEIRAKLLSSIRRYTNRIIQVNEPGNLPMFFSHPVAQTFLQFRGFTISAMDKSTLWHMKHHDTQAAMVALGDIVFGGATFALMTTIRAANRDDRDEYLAEQLTPTNLALMGFARGGISSVLPMLIDTGIMFTPMNPLFMGSRTSGTATDAIGGSAPIDLFNSIAGTTKAVADSIWSSRELSQQELRGTQRTMPYSNAIPTYLLFESMIKDRERMAPRQER